jgi:hypothetical protein
LAWGIAVVCLVALGALVARDRYLTRGIPDGLPDPVADGGARLGVNVYLRDADEATLHQTMQEIQAAASSLSTSAPNSTGRRPTGSCWRRPRKD